MLDIPSVAHLVQVIAEIRYAVLQIFPLVRLNLRGDDLLQLAQNPRCRMMLVFEIVTLFIKPLLTFRFIAANRRCGARQILSGMVEVQHRLIDMGAKKIPIGFCAIRNADETRFRIDFTSSISRPMRAKNVSFPYSGAAPR